MSLYRKYIKAEWISSIKNYKFKSSNDSITYKYFASPLCDKIVTYIPLWVAPNVITLTGFSFIILLTILIHTFSGPSGRDEIPGWVLFISGVCNYIYYLLDNCDGKQARRTKNSTPLGMLVDHNLDAVTTVLLTIAMTSVMKLADNPLNYLLVFFIGQIPFYLCTWEELHVGSLNLPCFNGVDEGNHIFSGLMIFTAFVGQDFWIKEVPLFGSAIRLNSITVFTTLITSTVFSIISIKNVMNYHRTRVAEEVKPNNHIDSENSNNESSTIANKHDILLSYFEVISTLFMCIALVISMILVFLTAGEDSIVRSCPKIVILCYGFTFSKLLIHLMMAHICNSEFEQWRTSSLSICIVLPFVSIFSTVFPQYIVEFNTVFTFYTIQNIVVWIVFAIKLSTEFCDVLGISFFKINQQNEKNEKYQEINNNEIVTN